MKLLMTGEQWLIYWNEYSAYTYLYGAEVLYKSKKNVIYKNSLMPPGTIIKRWFSKTVYQAARIEPSLPMIDGEISYELSSDMECNGGGCYLRIVFFDRYDKELDSMVVRDKSHIFKCPIQTHSYEIQLINAGADTILFHNLTIREILDEK